jgi:hypothetical protein
MCAYVEAQHAIDRTGIVDDHGLRTVAAFRSVSVYEKATKKKS